MTNPVHTKTEQLLREGIRSIGDKDGELEKLASSIGLVNTKTQEWLDKLISESPSVKETKKIILELADLRDPVLIEGESGTGKEILANALHGERRGNFIPVNCAGLPEQLVESELFGHISGAFTGAVRDKVGLFEAAQNGTLFIDEIGELPLSVQPKLLRVMQDSLVRRVGSTSFTPLNVRVVAATHRDLGKMMREGVFREDLYWRIATYTVKLPPLRERRQDIHEILDKLLDKEGVLSQEFREALDNDELSGNFRELEARVKREKLRLKLTTTP